MADAALAAVQGKGVSVSAVLSKSAKTRLQSAGQLPQNLRIVPRTEALGREELGAIVVEPFAPGASVPWPLAPGQLHADCVAYGFLLPEDGILAPSAAIVMAVAVECRGIWLARQPLREIQ